MQLETVLSPRVNELYRSSLRQYLDLNGQWDFALDPENTGEEMGYPTGAGLGDTIVVPGCLEAQGKGLVYGPITQPAWAGTSDIPYFGTSWYRKAFQVPAGFEGMLLLNFGGVATDCRVWLNGEELCEHHYGSIAFGVDVSEHIKRGGENILVVRVENNHNYDSNTPTGTHGFGSTTTEMRWSGIYRGVELVALPKAHLTDLFVKPDAHNSRITVEWESKGTEGTGWELDIAVKPVGEGRAYTLRTQADGSRGEATVDMPGALLWSDDAPNLYTASATLLQNGNPVDSLTERFGLRDIGFDGRHILLNGVPVYLRGEMTHFHWPGTISPCTDREDLRQRLGVYKEYGMNFMRHHTFFPHAEYLEVCDELGLLCHNELGVASNSWRIEEPHGPAMWQASIRASRNHPAVIVWCMGNEQIHEALTEDMPTVEVMEQYKALTFALDTTRLLQDNSPGFFHFPQGPKQKAPIHHELRKSGGSYIDPAAKRHYTGALRPWRMLWAEERTKEAGIGHLLPQFVRNTQQLQALTRKYVLEELRLNAASVLDEYYHMPVEYQGYELSTFRDSGSFVWGTVDDYMSPKAVSGEEFRHYNDASVLLWEFKWWSRIIKTGGVEVFLPVGITCSHYGKQPISGGKLTWQVSGQDGKRLAGGEDDGIAIPRGESVRICDTRWYIPEQQAPVKMTLQATLTWEGGEITNSWPFWCVPGTKLAEPACPYNDYQVDWTLKARLRQEYPFVQPVSGCPAPDAILLTGSVNDVLLAHLEQGGRALLASRSCFGGEVTEWGAARSEFARGTIIADHPLGAVFPHEGFCDIPYHGMISGQIDLNGRKRNDCGFAVGLRQWPQELVPIVAGIPSYKSPNPQLLGHLFEVKVGKGRLLITTFDFGSFAAQNPATAHYFDKVLRYLASNGFAPAVGVTPQFLLEMSKYGNTEIDKPTF